MVGYLWSTGGSLRPERNGRNRSDILGVVRRSSLVLLEMARQVVGERALLTAGDGRRRPYDPGGDLTYAGLAHHMVGI